MSRAWRPLVALLAAQTVLAAAAATREWIFDCGACRVGGLSLGTVGFAFYAGLLVAALACGPTRLLFGGLHFGFGIHVILAAQLVASGLPCWLCLAAAALSLALAALSVACDRANLTRMALVLPWPVLLILGWSGLPQAPEAEKPGSVRVVVYGQPDCPYCDELRARVLPEVQEEFGDRMTVVHRPADELAAIRMTPTVMVTPPHADGPSRVFEGLPTVPMLRKAIREAEGRP